MGNSFFATKLDTVVSKVSALYDRGFALSGRQFSVGAIPIAVALLVVCLGGYVGYRSMVRYENQLAVAEARETTLKAENASLRQEIRSDKEVIERITAAQARVEQEQAERDRRIEAKIEAVRKLKETVKVVEVVRQELKVEPTVVNDKLCFTPSEVAEFVAVKLERDKYQFDVVSLQNNLAMEKQKVSILMGDLVKADQITKNTEKSLQDYKKLAVKSKWKKFLGGVMWVGTHSAAVLIGMAIG